MWGRIFFYLNEIKNKKLHKYIKKIMFGLVISKSRNSLEFFKNKTYNEILDIMIYIIYNKTKKRRKVKKFKNRRMKRKRFKRYKKKINNMILKNRFLYKEKNNISDLKINNFENILKNNVSYFNNNKLNIINKDIILNFFNYYNNEYLLKNYLKDNYFKMNNYFLYFIIKKIYNLKSKNNLLKYFYIYLYNKHKNNNIFFKNEFFINRLYKKQFKYKLIERLNVLKNKIFSYICYKNLFIYNLILTKNIKLNYFLSNNINYDFQFNLFILILCNNIILYKLKTLK